MQYFVHNGFVGISYGTPGNPQLIREEDAVELMKRVGLSIEEVSAIFPPAQFAEEDDALFNLFGGARFLQYGDIERCADKRKTKIRTPLSVDWSQI